MLKGSHYIRMIHENGDVRLGKTSVIHENRLSILLYNTSRGIDSCKNRAVFTNTQCIFRPGVSGKENTQCSWRPGVSGNKNTQCIFRPGVSGKENTQCSWRPGVSGNKNTQCSWLFELSDSGKCRNISRSGDGIFEPGCISNGRETGGPFADPCFAHPPVARNASSPPLLIPLSHFRGKEINKGKGGREFPGLRREHGRNKGLESRCDNLKCSLQEITLFMK
jgi:hypothetical protein